ncbi:oxidation resistance protein 1 [Phtheirospermum japonicum]|uniref:Oxidation resistance protein 1 n=1 Tax=Phtheirospermum japonicum TaxID=374723 RepID=A0A830CM96_9LAMI|nr:oxidation resistance protein 1 [Phtheirospermum japonicum]
MHAIRDRVYEKLSKLFSDSQSSHETIVQDSEARQYAKDEKSQSSILSFVLPSTSLDWFRPNGRANEVRFTESNSFKWRSKSFSWKDKPLDTECNDEDKLDSHLENGEPGSGTSSSNSSNDVFEDAATPHTFEKPVPRLLDESIFVSEDLYHTVKHGISLHTLFRNSAYLNGPCLLITGDKQGAVFGGLLDCPLKPTAKRKYQCVLTKLLATYLTNREQIKVLSLQHCANRYFYLCLNDLLALGGGANFALSLNEDLLCGTSGPCETFGNLCLAHDQEFELKNVELWGFTTRISIS